MTGVQTCALPIYQLSELRNCKKCNRLFSSIEGSILCSRCNVNVDDGFNRVREYIYDNPVSSIKDVSKGTSVSSDIILKWIRDGRIVLAENSSISFCQRCGSPMDGGRFCGKCVKELADGLKEGIGSKDARPKAGMHIKEVDRKK